MLEGKIIKELNPGDIIRESIVLSKDRSIKEIARYMVLKRRIPEPNAQYYFVEYECLILYYGTDWSGMSHQPMESYIIDTLNLEQREYEWEIVVESGLSWDDNYHNG